MRFESDVVPDSDKPFFLIKPPYGLFESDVVPDRDKSVYLRLPGERGFESDAVSDSDKSEIFRSFLFCLFESDAVSDIDKPNKKILKCALSLRVMQFLMVMNRDILFFESILLLEGCFFCARKTGISGNGGSFFVIFSGGSGFSGWVQFLLCLLSIGLFFAEGWFFRENVKNP